MSDTRIDDCLRKMLRRMKAARILNEWLERASTQRNQKQNPNAAGIGEQWLYLCIMPDQESQTKEKPN